MKILMVGLIVITDSRQALLVAPLVLAATTLAEIRDLDAG
jgi:hypothetical protein